MPSFSPLSTLRIRRIRDGTTGSATTADPSAASVGASAAPSNSAVHPSMSSSTTARTRPRPMVRGSPMPSSRTYVPRSLRSAWGAPRRRRRTAPTPGSPLPAAGPPRARPPARGRPAPPRRAARRRRRRSGAERSDRWARAESTPHRKTVASTKDAARGPPISDLPQRRTRGRRGGQQPAPLEPGRRPSPHPHPAGVTYGGPRSATVALTREHDHPEAVCSQPRTSSGCAGTWTPPRSPSSRPGGRASRATRRSSPGSSWTRPPCTASSSGWSRPARTSSRCGSARQRPWDGTRTRAEDPVR